MGAVRQMRTWALAAICMAAWGAWAEEVDLHGGRGILFWSPEQQIIGYRAIDSLYPTGRSRPAPMPIPWFPPTATLRTFATSTKGCAAAWTTTCKASASPG